MLGQPPAHDLVLVQGAQARRKLLEQLGTRRGSQVRDEGRDVAASVGADRGHGHEQALHLLHLQGRVGPHLQERIAEPVVRALLQGQEVVFVEELLGPPLYLEPQEARRLLQ